MLEPVELKGPPAKSSIFKNLSLYTTHKITPQLPKNIKYTPPQSNEELRKRIGEQESKLNEVDRISVGVCLSYLERGLMEDDFGKDESKRHKLLLGNTVKAGDEEITLYTLAKIVNKLPKGVISNVIGLDTFVDDPAIKQKTADLRAAIKSIEEDRGYFVPGDLSPVDDLARSIIEHILR